MRPPGGVGGLAAFRTGKRADGLEERGVAKKEKVITECNGSNALCRRYHFSNVLILASAGHGFISRSPLKQP